MNFFKKNLVKIFINRNKPRYSRLLFLFCSKYIDFCYGDNAFDRETNGEYWLLGRLQGKMKVVFDVGANVGDYSKKILSSNPDVVVHAFEPDVRAFDQLQANTKDFKKRIILNNCAVGEKKAQMQLFRHSKTVFNSLFDIHEQDKKEKALMVQVTTLDEYVKDHNIRHVDFLKVDVEGYEFFVLKGAENMFKQGIVDMVQYEFSGATLESRFFLRDFLRFFESYGYDMYRLKCRSLERVEYFPDQERFTLTNFVAVKRGLQIDHIPQTIPFYH